MRMVACVIAVSMVGGCGDDGGGPAPQPDAPMALRYPIAFEVLGDTPILLARMDDDGTWARIDPTADNKYTLSVTNRHAIAIVCGSAVSGFRTEVNLRTRFDEDPFFFCSNGSDLPPQRFDITGQMMQAGQVSIGGASDEDTTSPWTFDLSVSGGTHDVVAYGETMALLRRGVQITANAALPAIDLAQGGAAYATTPVLLANAMNDETIETYAAVFTGNDIAEYRRTGTTLYELAPTLLTQSDFQFASIEAKTATTTRSSSIDGGGTPMITLMPRLDGITFTARGATWGELPDSTATIRIFTVTAQSSQTLEASGAYIAGDTEVGITLDIPGFDDAWRLTGASGGIFAAYDDESGETDYIEVSTVTARRAQALAASRRQLDRVKHVRSAAAVAARAPR